ncbi:hypothetical protein PTKIN_Ptkin03bG0144600 [Pterospermum kingtungense]
MKTRNKRDVLERVGGKMRMVNSYYVNLEGLSRGLSLWWNDKVSVKVLKAIMNYIDTLVDIRGKGITSKKRRIYGITDFEEIRCQREGFKKSKEIFPVPWMCIRNFNQVLTNEENDGGRMRGKRIIDNFQKFLNECELLEVPFKLQLYTWYNKRENGLVRERLDRALINMKWAEEFPCSQKIHLPIIGSNHCPIMLNSNFHDKKSPKRFKFEVLWAEFDGCVEVIKER